MLVDIKEFLEKRGCTDEEELYRNILSYIVASDDITHTVNDYDAEVFEWRTTLRDADSFSNQNKALDEEVLCIKFAKWCEDNGMYFGSDVGRVEEYEFVPVRAFDRKLLMPGSEYLRILGAQKEKPLVNVKSRQF